MNIATRASAPAKNRRARSADGVIEIAVQYATRSQLVPSASQIRKWVRAACRSDVRLTVRIVGTAEGRALNRTYRGKDYATNVLTFVLHDGRPLEGDIALCAPVVTREARAQSKNVTAHYAHLTVHGVLHLQGYEHEDDSHAREMERLEARILKQLGYPDPFKCGSNGRHTQ